MDFQLKFYRGFPIQTSRKSEFLNRPDRLNRINARINVQQHQQQHNSSHVLRAPAGHAGKLLRLVSGPAAI